MTTQPARVRKMFGSIARRYDLANHLLSCGSDFYWRRHAAEIVTDRRPDRVADLATRTGAFALALQTRLPHAGIAGVGVLPQMLDLAQRKGARQIVLADA